MIYLGSDHGGFKLKQSIKKYLNEKGYKYNDLGSLNLNNDDDYPDYAFKVAEKVSQDNLNRGILLCRSAAGMVIAANKVKNIRAVAVFDVESAKHSRQHNNANVIAISGDWTSEKDAGKIIDAWLNTEFTNEERHVRRLKKISDYEWSK